MARTDRFSFAAITSVRVFASAILRKRGILLWRPPVGHVTYYFPFRPGGDRANLILSKRGRLRTASGVRLSRVAIAAVLSPAAPIDRSSPSFSGVHGDPLISSP
jgi:hypothetical protein